MLPDHLDKSFKVIDSKKGRGYRGWTIEDVPGKSWYCLEISCFVTDGSETRIRHIQGSIETTLFYSNEQPLSKELGKATGLLKTIIENKKK